MKCISLWQPWATLLASGKKVCETRHWPIRHRGPLLIHAAKVWNEDLSQGSCIGPLHDALKSMGVLWHNLAPTPQGYRTPKPDLPFGAIVGRVDLVGCFSTASVGFDTVGLDCTPPHPAWEYSPGCLRLWHEQRAFGDFGPGRFAWLCSNPVLFSEPIPYRGAQGLFDVPDAILPEECRA